MLDMINSTNQAFLVVAYMSDLKTCQRKGISIMSYIDG